VTLETKKVEKRKLNKINVCLYLQLVQNNYRQKEKQREDMYTQSVCEQTILV